MHTAKLKENGEHVTFNNMTDQRPNIFVILLNVERFKSPIKNIFRLDHKANYIRKTSKIK